MCSVLLWESTQLITRLKGDKAAALHLIECEIYFKETRKALEDLEKTQAPPVVFIEAPADSLWQSPMARKKPSKTLQAWRSMHSRCRATSGSNHARYVKRGIQVCPEWSSYAVFLKDMGEAPSPAHSLDRIHNDRGYSKGNCRWATKQEQMFNQSRIPKSSGVIGVLWHKTRNIWQTRWGTEIIYQGTSLEEAIKCRKQKEHFFSETKSLLAAALAAEDLTIPISAPPAGISGEKSLWVHPGGFPSPSLADPMEAGVSSPPLSGGTPLMEPPSAPNSPVSPPNLFASRLKALLSKS